MILEKEVEVTANSKNYKYYKELGYSPVLTNRCQGNKFKVKIEHLRLDTHQLILCSCDVCGKENYVKYQNYNKYIKTDPEGKYTCRNCNYEKRKKSCLEIYGVENVSQNEKIKKKVVDTMKINGKDFFWNRKEEHKAKMIELYGVENVSQNFEIHMKQHNGYMIKHYMGLYYRGTYEKDFIDYCFKNKIEITNFKHGINYKFDGKNKKYFPDFYYKNLNLIIEIKSDYTYDKEKDMNEAKKYGSIKNGFNFMFIINKNYEEFEKAIKNQV